MFAFERIEQYMKNDIIMVAVNICGCRRLGFIAIVVIVSSVDCVDPFQKNVTLTYEGTIGCG